MKLAGITFTPVVDRNPECESNTNLINIPCDGCGIDCEIESSKYEYKTVNGNTYTLNQFLCSDCFVERWKKYRR